MTATNSIDATAEMQAYYGAEAGMQAALNVLRGNVAPQAAVNPSVLGGLLGGILKLTDLILNNAVTFLGAITQESSNLDSDPKTNPDGSPFPARLSRWLVYDYQSPGSAYNDRVKVNPNYGPFGGAAYSVTVSDPDNTPPGKQPNRLMIEATGYGPRGAQKKLTAILSRYALNIETPAPLVMRGHDDGSTNMTFDIGNSNPKSYSGHDRATIGTEPPKPAFAVSRHDIPVARAAYECTPTSPSCKADSVELPDLAAIKHPDPQPGPFIQVETPWFLRTTNEAKAILAEAEGIAREANRVFDNTNPFNGTAGTLNDPQITFVKGNCDLDGGAGLLIVTGDLSLKGNVTFDGIILVLGGGRVIRSGGGNGEIHGSMMIAKFNSTGGFLAPTFDVKGAGTSSIVYDSRAIELARIASGHPLLGIFEK